MDTQKVREILAKLHHIIRLDNEEVRNLVTGWIGDLGTAGMNGRVCGKLQDAVNEGDLFSFRTWLTSAWDFVAEAES